MLHEIRAIQKLEHEYEGVERDDASRDHRDAARPSRLIAQRNHRDHVATASRTRAAAPVALPGEAAAASDGRSEPRGCARGAARAAGPRSAHSRPPTWWRGVPPSAAVWRPAPPDGRAMTSWRCWWHHANCAA